MKPQITYQLWQQYNESGKIESVAFDFKGNLLSKQQQVISSAILKTALDNYQTYLVDWTGLPAILGTQIFETSSEYDALNRVTKITLPENVNNERKEITPTYNRAGALEKVSYDSTEYVENIAYNAKGQRLLIAFGNNIMTRYAYDNLTFRLLRQRSEKYTKTQVGNAITYTPQSGTNKQDDGFNFDLVGNILKTLLRVNDCGISGTALGSDALDRNFAYDPLYRVTSADGRESDTQHENDYLYSDAPAPGTPNANNVRAYTREFTFDKLGNVQQVKQQGTNGFTRNFSYNAGHNTLQKVETPTPTLIEDFAYDACGNLLTAGTTRNYVWNAGNQLITYYNQAGSADPTIFAQYDYAGQNRVSKMVRTGTSSNPIYERTIYIDGIFEYHILENGTTYEKNEIHIMDDKSRIAMVRVGTPFPDDIADAITYNLENQIGSSVARLDTNGTIIDCEEYYPFGDSSLRTFTKKRYRYVGKEKDLESGLYYYGARYYMAWACRFISIDPLAHDYMHLTPYNYAGNKPINSVDIDGMQGENEQKSTSNPEKIPAGNMTKTSVSTTDNLLEKTTAISTTNTERTFNLKNETFTITTTVTNTVVNTDKLTNKTTVSSSSFSSSKTMSYEEVTGKKFNPFEVELKGLLASEEYKKMDPLNQWNERQTLQSRAYQYEHPNAGSQYREQLDNSVMGMLPWYNIARGIQDIQEGNNWGWLKIGLEIMPLEILPPIIRRFSPELAYKSKMFGYNSYLFGIGRNGFQKGVLNSGTFRIGWGFEATSKSHVLRIGIGNNPRFFPATRMFGLDFHHHINLMKTPAKF